MSDPIDFEHLTKYTGGDLSLEAEVFALFREQTEMWLRLMTVSAEAEDWRTAAHTLKGSARGIGAFTLADFCERAELVADKAGAARAVALEDIRCAAEAVLDAAAARDYRREIDGLKRAIA